jgi:coatomer subunit delta
MNRLRIEGLLAAFPKLVGHAKQHTYVETDTVRYVYQPLENQMYLLLITTKASNIVEDLGTLRLLAKVVPDVAGGLHEHAINEHAFDLIFAFDEVLTAGGYKEEATLSSIRANLLMDSHEEKIHLALKESKEAQAKDEMRRKAKDIQDRHMASLRNQFVNGGTNAPQLGVMEGFGGGGAQGARPGMFDFNQQQKQQQQQSNGYDQNDPYGAYRQQVNPTAAVEAPKVLAKSGMKLGGAGAGMVKKNSLMAAMAAEDNFAPMAASKAKGGTSIFGDLSAPPAPAAIPSTPLSLQLEEKITCSINREGAVESVDLKGTLTLTANTDAGTDALITVNKPRLPPSFTYATHPKVDKKMYDSKGSLTLKGDKGFPVGRSIGILRWSYTGGDAAPLTINCWPEEEGSGMINVNIELELTRKDAVLHDVNILLPLGTTEPPSVQEIDGEFKHDPRAGMMCWHFDVIDANNSATATMEYRIAGHDTDAFFPIQIGFRSESLLCPIELVSITNAKSGVTIPNQLTRS